LIKIKTETKGLDSQMRLEFNITSKDATRFFIRLLFVEIILVMIYFTDFVCSSPNPRIHELFNLDKEANIPTWFSLIQLFLIGLIALMTAFNKKYSAPPSRRGLKLFGLGFIYLSLDEGAVLHEKMTYEFHNHPLVPYFDGVHGIWITVYMGVALLVLSLIYRDLWAIFNTYRREAVIFIFGLLVYLAGAGGAETITYFYIDKSNPLIYAYEVCLEEFLEMAGASILFYSVLLTAVKKNQAPA